MATTKAMQTTLDYRTIVQKTSDALIPMVREQMAANGVPADDYQVQCMANAITIINDLVIAEGISLNDVDRTSLVESLQQTAMLRLNPFSQPRECYFMLRNKKDKKGGWNKLIEMGIEGDGNESILRSFGHNVDTVYPYWEVREDDQFKYPHYSGIETDPPEWTPGGTGKVARVVYPIKYKDGTVRYFIGEREDVRVNLMAHISNNLLNETFNIAESRYKATVDQKKQIDARKKELLALADGKTLDEILDIPELQPYISPAWAGDGRERMIVRKMRNNVIKPIPKDFGNAMLLAAYSKADVEQDERPNPREITTIDIPTSDFHEVQTPQPKALTPQPKPAVSQQAKPEPEAPGTAPF